jgi:16S rRNA (uracil1498-N3)-methyltransferase
MTRVLRTAVGETVYVTNGRGVIVRCRVEERGRREARLRVLGVEANLPVLPSRTLALAVLRKDAFERAVEQCTELGVTTFLPVVCERSHVRRYSPAFIERLRRVAVSAAKQSFRSTFPVVEAAVAFDELVARVSGESFVVVGDVAAPPLERLTSVDPLVVVVGPESGLAESERAALAGVGARLVSVSPHRLRSETAAVALLSVALSGKLRGEGGRPVA